MNAQISTNGKVVSVQLSRKNLLDLLALLDHQQVNPQLIRRTEDNLIVYVQAQEDAVHYAERHAGPGYRHSAA